MNREYIIPASPAISNESKEFLHLCLKKNPEERASAQQLIKLKLFKEMNPLQSKVSNQQEKGTTITSNIF